MNIEVKYRFVQNAVITLSRYVSTCGMYLLSLSLTILGLCVELLSNAEKRTQTSQK